MIREVANAEEEIGYVAFRQRKCYFNDHKINRSNFKSYKYCDILERSSSVSL
jgi:hypothetical protein